MRSDEAWRMECEADMLLRLPLAQRREYLKSLKRSPEHIEQLKREITRLWQSRRTTQSAPDGLPGQVGVRA
jgi:hypothetical protein